MKKYSYIIAILTVIIIILLVCFCTQSKAYPSPEDFCQIRGYESYHIVRGTNSALVIYNKSPNQLCFAFLKETEEGFISTGYQRIVKEFSGPNYATIYKGNGTTEHYIVFVMFGNEKLTTINDSLNSSFTLIPSGAPENDGDNNSYFVAAYIGTYSDNYYRQEYKYEITSSDNS